MKKVLVAIILILSALIPTACSCGKDSPQMSITRDSFCIAMNETIDLNDYIKVSGTKDGFDTIYSSENISIENGIVTPLCSGDTTVKCVLREYEDIFVVISISVRDVYLATSVGVPNANVIINMGTNNTAINKVQVAGEITEIPSITYDESVINYEYLSGTITAKKVGETIVKVAFEKCQVEFRVTVENIVYVEYFSVEDMALYVGDSGVFNYIKIPANANEYRFYTSSSLLSMDSQGNYTAVSSGVVEVNYEYVTKNGEKLETKTGSFSVEIKALPDAIDIQVFDINNNGCSEFWCGEKVKLVISLNGFEKTSDFEILGDIEVVSEGLQTDDDGNSYVLIKSTKVGQINISVSCNILLEDASRKISKSTSIFVRDLGEISMIAKYGIYILQETNGEYVVNAPEDTSMEISFLFEEGGVLLEGVELYLGDSKLSDTRFLVESVGRYTIHAMYRGILIKEIVVVVE